MKKHLLPLLIVAALLIAACSAPSQPAPAAPTAAPTATTAPAPAEPTPAPAVEPTSEPAAEPATAGSSTLTVEVLMNATYSGIYDEPVTLSDGLYEGEPFAAGDPARPTVQYVEGAEVHGDMDGDGVDDAVVFLMERGGGTANIVTIAAQLNQGGQPVDAGAVRLEEVQVKSASVADGRIALDLLTAGPGDGDCCGSYKASKTLALQDGKLAEVAAEVGEPQRVSAADLDGTTWTLLEINRDQLAAADAEVTLSFAGDQISGFGGCNNYTASFSLGEDNPLTMAIGPVAATKKACPDPIGSQETAFFTALQGVSEWGYEFGRLGLYYQDDQAGELGRLLFAPASSETKVDDTSSGSVQRGEGALAGVPLLPADIANDEGGPVVATGEWAYTAAAVATHYLEPVVVLMDLSREIQRNYTEWVPRSGQIMGILTRPLAPAPTAYRVDLPVQPNGASVDRDNDGEMDTGVQVFAAVLGTNLVGDSYLEQVEQAGFTSYLNDPQTGDIRKGAFLVYAPDDAQGFPSAAGEDGVYFTADDPAVGLPAGWTLVTLGEDGQVSFDRSREATTNILEAAAYASPDFSDQGILESFNSLIDLLAVRYSYTELRRLDWEQICQEYLPRVEAADAAGDFAAYYAAMNDLALSIKDAHVYLTTSALENKSVAAEPIEQAFGGGLGVEVKELSDGRVVVTYLDSEGPGAQAGWQVGTEIVSVDGLAIGDRIATLPIADSAGNPEVIRLQQMKHALAFPAGAETTIGYRQPEASDVLSATLTAVEGAFADAPKPAVDEADISFKDLGDGIWYVQWKMFRDPLYKIAVWEKLLKEAQGASGLIIDMRHNGGGATDLMYTLASYLFPADDPAKQHWIDNYTYDEKAGDLVKEFAADRTLSSPRPDLPFNGAVAVLVGEGSASAAEYLPQFLQRQGRAIVVGEHGTEGAGGYLEQAAMPGGFTFHFTKGRTFFAGTDELNLEAKGVDLDVRVPITLENELAKQEGRDVVLAAAIAAAGEEAARLAAERLPGTTWQLMTLLIQGEDGNLVQASPTTPLSYTLTFEADGVMSIQAGCNQVNAEYVLGSAGAITITPGAATLASCADDGLGENLVTALGKIIQFQTDGQSLVFGNASEVTPVSVLMTRVEGADAQ